MKVDFSKEFLGMRDEVMLNEGVPFTLKDATTQVLVAVFEDDRNVSAADKVKRFDLFMKIKDAKGVVTLEAADVVLIKDLIGKAYGALIVGQAFKLLEGS